MSNFTYYPAVGERPAYSVWINNESGNVYASILQPGDGFSPQYGPELCIGSVWSPDPPNFDSAWLAETPEGDELGRDFPDAKAAAMALVDLHDSALAST